MLQIEFSKLMMDVVRMITFILSSFVCATCVFSQCFSFRYFIHFSFVRWHLMPPTWTGYLHGYGVKFTPSEASGKTNHNVKSHQLCRISKLKRPRAYDKTNKQKTNMPHMASQPKLFLLYHLALNFSTLPTPLSIFLLCSTFSLNVWQNNL